LILAGARDISLLQNICTDSGASHSMGTGALFPGDKMGGAGG